MYVVCATPRKDQGLTRCNVAQVVSIDALSEEVLLVIFDFYVDPSQNTKKEIETWQSLVHVCQRWRSVVFGSPRRLDLRLVCTTETPWRYTLDVWPPLPLVIRDHHCQTNGVDNIIAVLERCRDRVCRISLSNLTSWDLVKVSAAMQEPFPELTYLAFCPNHEMVPVLPDSFLGGSAQRLQTLRLDFIQFSGLPRLLLSATHLVALSLWNIPPSGYLSLAPEAMLPALSTLTSLRQLILQFGSPLSYPDGGSRRPPPPMRFVLPALIYLDFKGVSDYLEDLVARVDLPQICELSIIFFNQIVFDTPRFIQFISRTPNLKVLEKASVVFGDYHNNVYLSSQTGHTWISVGVICRELDWQISSVEQICTSCLPPLPTLEELYIYKDRSFLQPDWRNSIENFDELWLELLHPFTGVKNLYLSKEFAPRIVPALRELVEGRTAEVLPTLQNIFLEELQPSEPVQKGIGQFVAARQFTGHPVAVSRWDRIR